LLVAACNSEAALPTSDIVSTIPWPADESLTYVVEDDDGETLGHIVLSVDVGSDDTELSSRFSGGGNTDEGVVRVESQTLKPISSHRRIDSGDEEEVVESTYTDEGVLIRHGDRQSGLPVPEHAYDNDSSLFLWRTIAFAEGYESSYVTIITNHRTRDTVTLRVTGRESVTVPAGTFNAWRLEIRGRNARQTAWYADIPSRPLLRYDNDRGLIFELQTPP
jgi:hypothetical protein